MSEEKLTVAELMSRAGKEPTANRPRRRRRSLEEGGVSVADLTGSQRRVNAPGPRRGAHAADDPVTTQAKPEEKVSAAPKAEPKPESKAADREPRVLRRASAEQPADEATKKPEPKAAKPEPKPAPKPATPAAPEFKSAFNVPAAVPANPVVIDINPDEDEMTLALTAFNDAKDGITPVAEPGTTVKDILGLQQPQPTTRPKVTAPGEANTDVQPVIPDEDAPAEAEPTDAKKPVEDKTKTDKPAAAAAGAGAAAAGAGALAGAAASKTTESAEPRSSQTDATTTAEVPGMADEVNRAAPAERDEQVDHFDHDDDHVEYVEPFDEEEVDEYEEEDNSLSIALLIVQVIVGLVAGAFLFVAFTWAWAQLPVIAAAIAAIVVTVVMVLIANRLRRKRDKLTPILAGVVGLLLTFGPYLLMMR